MKFWTKKLTAPLTNETHQVDAVQLWEVRWRTYNSVYDFSRGVPQMEAFASETRALDFADSLRAAFKLTRNTLGAASIEMQKAE